MRIGMIGLGKLGMPVAVAIADRGHDVMGYDIDPKLMSKDPRLGIEDGCGLGREFNKDLHDSSLKFGSLEETVTHADILFVAVQTPHDPKFEGRTPLLAERADFNYSFLMSALVQINAALKKETVVVIISTVLPGTYHKWLEPILWGNKNAKLCYNPFFIAMGTTIRDFLFPEFVLLGFRDNEGEPTVSKFYRSITTAKLYRTSIENAELIKVAYNTYIGQKIVFANTLMEICDHIPGCDVDQVTGALALADRRLISPAYMSGGMGDGGGCHPRDNIAMSWLARELNLSYDWFGSIMQARECQTEWLARVVIRYTESSRLPVSILGYAFKAESNLVTGSPALLLKSILEGPPWGELADSFDPIVSGIDGDYGTWAPHVFFIGTNHKIFKTYQFPKGSVVIDPWRYLHLRQEGVTYVPLGIGDRRT
jgi:UDPglucose 6-dehydrogenase